jgi:hypothetical protein
MLGSVSKKQKFNRPKLPYSSRLTWLLPKEAKPIKPRLQHHLHACFSTFVVTQNLRVIIVLLKFVITAKVAFSKGCGEKSKNNNSDYDKEFE